MSTTVKFNELSGKVEITRDLYIGEVMPPVMIEYTPDEINKGMEMMRYITHIVDPEFAQDTIEAQANLYRLIKNKHSRLTS